MVALKAQWGTAMQQIHTAAGQSFNSLADPAAL